MEEQDIINMINNNKNDISLLDAKVDTIEISNARVDVQIQHLIDSVNKLANSVKMVFFGAMTGGIGFILWYIQQL